MVDNIRIKALRADGFDPFESIICVQTRLSKVNWEPNREAELLGRKSSEQEAVRELTEVN